MEHASQHESEIKTERVRALLKSKGLDALLLNRVSSFAWATCGVSSYINTAADNGVASLLYTPSDRFLITNTIEAPRFEREDALPGLGWSFLVHDWYAASSAVEEQTRGMRVGCDGPYPGTVDLSEDVARVRAALSTGEVERFRALARLCADAMAAAIRQVRPGQTEHEIAAFLANETTQRGVWPVVDLVATDDRIRSFRHPLPTDKTLRRYAMLVLCGRKWGLVCSLTRLVHFGRLPDDLRKKQDAVARVDATFVSVTRPGAALRDVLARAVHAYEAAGFASEWHLHHQGGAAGYEPREYVATPTSSDIVQENQVFAWNPSITGTKIEDTILVGSKTNEVLTQIEGWPAIDVEVDGQRFARPAVLEVS